MTNAKRNDRRSHGGRVEIDTLERRMLFAGDVTIAAPHSTVAGKTIGEWTAGWWQWALSIPVGQNPVLDTTGANANVGQSGPVFYLAGSFGGPVTRTQVHVPAKTNILIPLANTTWIQLPTDPPMTIAERRQASAALIDTATDLFATIDGQPVQNLFAHREVDPFVNGYSITMPDDNVFGGPPAVPGGTYTGCTADGYYLMLTDIPNGNHTLHVGSQSFNQDVTYQLQVVGKPTRTSANSGAASGVRDGDLISPTVATRSIFSDARPIDSLATELAELN